jgi:hypothetical protein
MTQRAANAQATKMIKITTSCQCAGDKDDKKERLYGGYNDRLRRGFLLLPQLSEQEGGVSRILVVDKKLHPVSLKKLTTFSVVCSL